jgi:hypothetical protein
MKPGTKDLRSFFYPSCTIVGKVSRGGRSLHSGVEWETRCAERLRKLCFGGYPISVGKTAGGGRDQDIPTLIAGMQIGWEAKNKGAFEGGGTTLYEVDGRLSVPEKYPLLRSLFADHVPWGRIPAKKELVDDDYIDVPSDSLAKYYREKGSVYVIVEGMGLYHTGEDVLNLDVPYIVVPGMRLRTRVTKHMQNGVPTDVSTAIVFPRKNLVRSSFCIFDRLPAALTEAGE